MDYSQGQSDSQCQISSNPDHDLLSTARIGDSVKAIDIYSRRDAGTAERFTGIRRSDFSREHRQFATKVAPTDH